ncbi:ABC transporter ATP-binding protein [Pseudohalioglobus sediminis]|uniref:ABC transporter ATP-binding protein n=1 Tax=Pseudohalioglobus sediminis TaxID=2606449 RepID=A0A5B0X6V5_9GAMM|nr:ABC transporter ATP-binding protein [Pseudohalioglobus sediminis]KAA1194318.1 ABC transporter ATP-binding protein [Pseudohalioglobus sediminis]
MPRQLELQSVSVNYGDVVAAKDISFGLGAGEIGCLLGPSGCGKTTLLRAIAGFEPVSAGSISLHGELISSPSHNVPPEQRRVGMVFQDFALFPHLSIEDNVGFGLRTLARRERRRRVEELLELVGLGDFHARFPHELSGGQQQRVALARALAPEPEIILLDEPFSSLDSALRETLAVEVRALLKARNVTAVLVTHDQHEAFAMADSITLLNEGEIVQSDSAYNLYHHPRTRFAAAFIGDGALLTLTAADDKQWLPEIGLSPDSETGHPEPGALVQVLVRPEDVVYDPQSRVQLTVLRRAFRGAEFLYTLALPDGQQVQCLASSQVDVATGEALPVRFNQRHIVLL